MEDKHTEHSLGYQKKQTTAKISHSRLQTYNKNKVVNSGMLSDLDTTFYY